MEFDLHVTACYRAVGVCPGFPDKIEINIGVF
jgi:hypothetical protein